MALHSLPMAAFPVNTRVLTNNIPLLCNICPKKPSFSDVSHLLTHIASKGHLSTYYKVKVRAGQEPASRMLIEDYDTWYATWNIEDLMSERMNIKEQKRRPRARLSSVTGPRMPRAASTISGHHLRGTHPAVDPQLGSAAVKNELHTRNSTPFSNVAPLPNPYMFPTQPWFRLPYAYPDLSMKHEEKEEGVDEDEPCSLYSPTPTRFGRPSRGLGSGSNAYTDDLLPDVDDDLENDANKLKGVLWPGMNMFDAATPEMKRRRNQRKATSVVEQLETTSKEIEATELVFTPSGTLRKARHISGLPDLDSSPLQGEEMPPKKPKRVTRRKALTEQDPNINRSRRSQRKAPTQQSPYFRSVPASLGEEEVDDAITYVKTRGRPKKKRKLHVHADQDVTATAAPIDQENIVPAYMFSPGTKLEHLGSAVPSMPFRPAETMGYYSQGYSGLQADYTLDQPNHIGSEAAMLPAWEFLGQDLSGNLSNPLYLGDFAASLRDDDEQTISAPASEQ